MKKLKLINIKQVQAFNPCGNRLANAAKYYSKKSYTYAQMLNLKNITQEDKVWLSFKLMSKTNIFLASADMGELVRHLYEAKYPLYNKPRLAIKAARSGNTATSKATLRAAYDASYYSKRATALTAGDAAKATIEKKIRIILLKYLKG